MFKTCNVRLVAKTDLALILSWRNHPDVRRLMFTQHQISWEEHLQWFSNACQDNSRCLLIVEESNKPIGYVQFTYVATDGVVNWGFYTDPDAAKGTGRKLGKAALNHAFDVLNLHKVCGQAIGSNVASIGFHRSLGFSQEGLLRDHQHIDGKYQDLYCFGLLSREWPVARNLMEKT